MSEKDALHEARRCLSHAAIVSNATIASPPVRRTPSQARPRPSLRDQIRALHGLRGVCRAMSLPRHGNDPRAGVRQSAPACRSEIRKESQVMGTRTTMDGNTAVAHVAYRVNEVCAIFPIPRRRPWPNWPTSGRLKVSRTSGGMSPWCRRCRAREGPPALSMARCDPER